MGAMVRRILHRNSCETEQVSTTLRYVGGGQIAPLFISVSRHTAMRSTLRNRPQALNNARCLCGPRWRCYWVARVVTVRTVSVRNVSARAIAAGSVYDVYLVQLTFTIASQHYDYDSQHLVSVTQDDR